MEKKKDIKKFLVIIIVVLVSASLLLQLYNMHKVPTQSVAVIKNYDANGKYIGYSKIITGSSCTDSSKCNLEQDEEKK